MHPAACLLSWLMLVVAAQALPWQFVLALGAVLAMGGKGVLGRWRTLVRRARWLFLSVFLILSYGAAGEALFDLAWMPTDAGVAEAGLHVLRLIVLLGTIAWLFERLDRPKLLAAMWALAQPFSRLGVQVAPAVVRLALVFELVDAAPARGSWRQLLTDPEPATTAAEHVRIESPAWRQRDTLLLLGMAALLAAASLVP